MKKLTFLLFLIGLSFVLSGCLKIVEIINDNYNSYTFEPGVAVVIVGGYGDTGLSDVNAVINDGKYTFAIPSALSKNIDAFAWKINVGDSFSVVKVRVNGGSSGRYVEFPKSHTLRISEQGIYYYGTLVSRADKAGLIPKVVPEVVAVARAKYPRVFENLKPLNF